MYYPLEKEEVLARGWKWDEYENPVVAKKTIPANRLPDNIKDIPDDILNWAIVCEITGQPFKITPQELSFYRDRSLPIPHLHPYQRHLNRFKRRNPRHLYPRQCAKCHAETQTTYSPDRPEVVYCEHCYLKNIY